MFPNPSTWLAEPLCRLDAAVVQIPWLGKVLGHRPTQPKAGEGPLSSAAAEMLCRMAFLPASVTRTMSAGRKSVLKARAFMANFILHMQTVGLAMMFSIFGRLTRKADGNEGEYIVAFGVNHSWDETKQMVREMPSPNPFLRQPNMRIGRNILVQTSMVHSMGVSRNPSAAETVVHHRAETFLVPTQELMGKTTGFLAKAILGSMAIPLEDTAKLRDLASRVSVLIITFWGDAAKTNGRFLKHVCGLCVDNNWPRNVLVDPAERCLLHQLHRVKTRQLEGHALVSLAYCFAKLIRAGSILALASRAMTDFITKTCKRVVQAPPADKVQRTRRVFDLLYNLDSSHHVVHGTRGTKPSTLLGDIEFLLKMDAGSMLDRSADTMVHYCWKGDGSSSPCCANHDEMVDKMVAAYLNLFLCHSCPSGSLSRWTHVGSMLAILSSGFICRDIFFKAVMSSLPADEQAAERAANLQVGAAGAGDSDYAAEHAARVSRVRAWLGKVASRLQIGVLFLLVKHLDSIMYFLMGGNTRDGARSRKPGTVPRAEEPLPTRELFQQVATASARLLQFLCDWHDPESDSASLLLAMGVENDALQQDDSMRFARRLCVGFSAGLFRRFILKLNTFPYRLWVLADEACDADARATTATEFYVKPTCCLGFFGQALRRLFPDAATLLSTFGRTTVATWLRTLTWSIYGCEKEHASCRRLLQGTGPSRSWTLCARERLLESSRTVHLERTSWDPALAPNAPRQPMPALQSGPAGGAGVPALNPLHADERRPADGVGMPLQLVHVGSDLSAALAVRPPQGGAGHGIAVADPAHVPQAPVAEAGISEAPPLLRASFGSVRKEDRSAFRCFGVGCPRSTHCRGIPCAHRCLVWVGKGSGIFLTQSEGGHGSGCFIALGR